jgi:2-phosphoglycerate kinase
MTAEGACPWRILLIGGGSGTGKTRTAELVAGRFGIPWLQVDDFRLALQRATTADQHPALHYFLAEEPLWARPEEELVEALKEIARLMSAALEIVIAHHLSLGQPVVIEGDALDPRMAAGTHFAGHEAAGLVRSVVLVEPHEDAVLAAMEARGPRGGTGDEATLPAQARVAWLYGQWLQGEALRLGLPVVSARPYERLAARVEKDLR